MKKQTALITGASSGIGYELSKIFAKNGFHLVLIARSKSKLDHMKKKLETQYGNTITVIVQDMTKSNAAEGISSLLDDYGINVDILVNNAGFGDHTGFLDSDWNKQKKMVELNIIALTQMTYIFGAKMRRRGYGRILNISSVAAFFSGPYMSIYYASKAFVLSFSEAVAEELKASGVTVTALCPGPTTTGFEAAAEMKGSRMFTFTKPQKASVVALAGYRACMAGKSLCYSGRVTKFANIGARVAPRLITRKIMKSINGIPKNDFSNTF